MRFLRFFRSLPYLILLAALSVSLSAPASALFWTKKNEPLYVADFSKNGLAGSVFSFNASDFAVRPDSAGALRSITIQSLPDPGAGTLVLGGQPICAGTQVDITALSGLRFQSTRLPTVATTSFSFIPTFSSGQTCPTATATLHLLAEQNQIPVARNMELSTYKNVAVTGYFDAVDADGDLLTFQLTSTPARGSVTLSEDGSSRFVYTPYENKTGTDSFSYVAVDSVGNVSPEAKITLRIEKANTKVTYADLEGHSSHKSAIRLAEEGIYVGQYMDGRYFFDPDAPVSRAQFLTLAMSVSGMEPLEQVSLTGFADDASIPVWAKGCVSAALKAGAVQGGQNELGAPVFDAHRFVTFGEATVMLNRLLNVTDVPAEVFFSGPEQHWAAQSVANLAASGVIRPEDGNTVSLSASLTRGEAAELLDKALDLLSAREGESRFFW